jgi:hypothetical protein
MAISRVQAKSAQVSPAASVSLTLNSATTSGNLLVLCVSCYYAGANAGNAWTASDNKGNTWTSAVLTDTTGKMQIFYAQNITGGASHQVTLTVAGPSNTYLIITVLEYSGVATSSALDKANAAFTATNTTAYTSPTSATTTQADELLIGCHHAYQSAATPTPATNWTTVATQAGSTFHTHAVQERIVTATGAYASSGTWSATGPNHTDAIVTFKAAGGGTAYSDSVSLAASVGFSPSGNLSASAALSFSASTGVFPSGPASLGSSVSLAATMTMEQSAALAGAALLQFAGIAAMGGGATLAALGAVDLAAMASANPAALLDAASAVLLATGVGMTPLSQVAASASLGLAAIALLEAYDYAGAGGNNYTSSLALATSVQMEAVASLMVAGVVQMSAVAGMGQGAQLNAAASMNFAAMAAMAQQAQAQIAAALNLAVSAQLQALSSIDGAGADMVDFMVGAAEYLLVAYSADYLLPLLMAEYQTTEFTTEYLA